MQTNQKSALAAFLCALSFVVGLTLILVFIPDYNNGADNRLRVISDYPRLMQTWYFVVYIVFSLAITQFGRLLFLAENREPSSLEHTSILATYAWASYIFASGLIAIFSIELLFGKNLTITNEQAALWQDIYLLQMGLGEGAEWVGGIWATLINLALYKRKEVTKFVPIFGFIVAAIGIASLVPFLTFAGALFGLLQVVWFLAIATNLFRLSKN